MSFLTRLLPQRARSSTPPPTAKAMQPAEPSTWRSFMRLFGETFTGSFQQDAGIDLAGAEHSDPVYACVTLIARDIAKLPLRLEEEKASGIWAAANSPAFSPVLGKPNHYQTRIQFIAYWVISKLMAGNTYVLKVRDQRQVVTALHVLDPHLVTPLVTEAGFVYYQLGGDPLAELGHTGTVVPASEIIHDRCIPLHHPLIGVSPLYAAALPAALNLAIQRASAKFFGSGSRPGGILEVPGTIKDDQADRLRREWKQRFSGENAGQLAVLSGGMKFTPLHVPASDNLTPEQARDAAQRVCSAFHVPAWKIGAAPMPAYGNVQAGQTLYYSDCLQEHIESIEALLDEGLGLTANGLRYGTSFEVEALLRMDSLTKTEAAAKAVGAAIKSPDEARREFGLPPVDGGDTPYLQQQNYSLRALARRDAREDPFGNPAPAPAQTPAPPAPPSPSAPADADGDSKAATAHLLDDGLSPAARSYLKHLVEHRLAQAA